VSAERPAWHLVTGEYPPVDGGVSAFTAAIADGLVEAGRDVVVWTPGAGGNEVVADVQVRRLPNGWTPSGFRIADAALDADRRPRIFFVQWVPHAFGRRSLNLGFCRWARRRARRGDRLVVMVHEPFLPFAGGARQHAAAAMHRLMLRQLLSRAERVWLSIPAWRARIAPHAPRAAAVEWLPVPSSIPVARNEQAVAELRARLAGSGGLLVGHFGTFSRESRRCLDAIVPGVLEALPRARVLLIGRGSSDYAAEVVRRSPAMSGRIHATGVLGGEDVSFHLQACDLLVLPYVDGASARRTTLMAGLAHGRAVVTTVGELSEPWWRESEAVDVVPADRPDQMIGRIVSLAADCARRRRLESTALALYESRFAVEHAVSRLLAHEQPIH
jgi:glycosyltransferase involved in cell wall biosynthesis